MEATLVRGLIPGTKDQAIVQVTPNGIGSGGEIWQDVCVSVPSSFSVSFFFGCAIFSHCLMFHLLDCPILSTQVYNPSFDCTPADLISCVVTEKGVGENLGGKDSIDLSAVC